MEIRRYIKSFFTNEEGLQTNDRIEVIEKQLIALDLEAKKVSQVNNSEDIKLSFTFLGEKSSMRLVLPSLCLFLAYFFSTFPFLSDFNLIDVRAQTSEFYGLSLNLPISANLMMSSVFINVLAVLNLFNVESFLDGVPAKKRTATGHFLFPHPGSGFTGKKIFDYFCFTSFLAPVIANCLILLFLLKLVSSLAFIYILFVVAHLFFQVVTISSVCHVISLLESESSPLLWVKNILKSSILYFLVISCCFIFLTVGKVNGAKLVGTNKALKWLVPVIYVNGDEVSNKFKTDGQAILYPNYYRFNNVSLNNVDIGSFEKKIGRSFEKKRGRAKYLDIENSYFDKVKIVNFSFDSWFAKNSVFKNLSLLDVNIGLTQLESSEFNGFEINIGEFEALDLADLKVSQGRAFGVSVSQLLRVGRNSSIEFSELDASFIRKLDVENSQIYISSNFSSFLGGSVKHSDLSISSAGSYFVNILMEFSTVEFKKCLANIYSGLRSSGSLAHGERPINHAGLYQDSSSQSAFCSTPFAMYGNSLGPQDYQFIRGGENLSNQEYARFVDSVFSKSKEEIMKLIGADQKEIEDLAKEMPQLECRGYLLKALRLSREGFKLRREYENNLRQENLEDVCLNFYSCPPNKDPYAWIGPYINSEARYLCRKRDIEQGNQLLSRWKKSRQVLRRVVEKVAGSNSFREETVEGIMDSLNSKVIEKVKEKCPETMRNLAEVGFFPKK